MCRNHSIIENYFVLFSIPLLEIFTTFHVCMAPLCDITERTHFGESIPRACIIYVMYKIYIVERTNKYAVHKNGPNESYIKIR